MNRIIIFVIPQAMRNDMRTIWEAAAMAVSPAPPGSLVGVRGCTGA